MGSARPSLEDDVSAVFARACRERDWQVAEYLLQALEEIARREGQALRLGSALEELARELSMRRH
jgi:hypothetical protein